MVLAVRRQAFEALVWKRSDFRETSRLVTLLTEAQGKIMALAKGAHRPNSQCLGRIDFLNHVEVRLSGARLPVLHRIRLIHEPRRLREPRRYLCASYLSELFDLALPMDRPDPPLYQLLLGGLRLLERARIRQLPQILAGIELRFLRELGQKPVLLACSSCGRDSGQTRLYWSEAMPALFCAGHSPRSGKRRQASLTALRWLSELEQKRGAQWPSLPPVPRAARDLLGYWIAAALERRPRMREQAFIA